MIDDVQYFTQASGLKTAYHYTQGCKKLAPTLVFLPGYMSDMEGAKAQAIFAYAQQNKQACLLMDYSGCGKSEGDFANASLSIWRDEVCALIENKTDGPIILMGSSMGGWLMLMIAMKLVHKHGADKIYALIGIAAAPDFTQWDFDDRDKKTIRETGVLMRENNYGYDPTPMHQKFHQDGQNNLLLDSEICLDCPVYLFHGQDDEDVPFEVSMKLAQALRSSQVHIYLIKDASHRFSRDQDVAVLTEALDRLMSNI